MKIKKKTDVRKNEGKLHTLSAFSSFASASCSSLASWKLT